ncbi:PhzF family phenazine biosynthesis protein [Actinomadura keratinilytica]
MSLADTPAPPTAEPAVLRYAAFTRDPAGGNPAGVVLDAAGLDEATMLAVAARLGYSETAFLTPPLGAARPPRASAPTARGTSARRPRCPSAATPRWPPP